MRTQVIIDADFLNIFLSFKDGEILFKDIMESLGFSPVIHQYVADNELDVNQKAKQLIDENIIERIPYDKIFNDKYKKFYQIEFEEYYKEQNIENIGKLSFYNKTFHSILFLPSAALGRYRLLSFTGLPFPSPVKMSKKFKWPR